MPEKAQRRRFTAAYKLKVLAEAAECRAARRRGELAGLAIRRGPPRKAPNPLSARVARLERQLAAATQRAERAEAIVAVQKKVAALLGDPLPPTAP